MMESKENLEDYLLDYSSLSRNRGKQVYSCYIML